MVKAFVKALVFFVVVTHVLASSDAVAQGRYPPQQPVATIDLSGPRVGVTVLSNSTRELLGSANIGPVISQFGWQKERRFLTGASGLTAVTELVLLAGGLDQGVLLPSASWLVGVRGSNGAEFAVGPNLSVGGAALAIAAGVTFRAGNLNFPVNVAAVPSRSGLRVSVLAGFNSRRP
jgi:hypothetical protein